MSVPPGQRHDVVADVQQSIMDSETKRRRQRFSHNLGRLLSASLAVLEIEEFAADLAAELSSLSEQLSEEQKRDVLTVLAGGVVDENIRIRERSMTLVTMALGYYIEQSKERELSIICDIFCVWLGEEKQVIAGFEVIYRQFEMFIGWLLESESWESACRCLEVLKKLSAGEQVYPDPLIKQAGRILNNLVGKKRIAAITDLYLISDDRRQTLQRIVMCFGTPAITYLMRRLIDSESREERRQLVFLLAQFGHAAVPILAACLDKNPPWQVVRNVVQIIGQIGDGDLFPRIRPYLHHHDRRVQLETVECIGVLGGPRVEERLLEALQVVYPLIKIHVIRLLVELGDRGDTVFNAIRSLAVNRGQLPAEERLKVVTAIVSALRYFPHDKTLQLLAELDEEGNRVKSTEILRFHLDQTRKIIASRMRRARGRTSRGDEISFDSDPVARQQALTKLRDLEKQITSLLASGDAVMAGQLVYDRARDAAEEKDFLTAELLRDRLLEVNPMALEAVIELGEYIEEQRNSSVSKKQLHAWNELFSALTTAELNALYNCLESHRFVSGERIVDAGEIDPCLFFLNSGFIGLHCQVGSKEVFLKKMKPGELLGWDQFTDASVWTVSLVAQTEVNLQLLGHERYMKLVDKYPNIMGKFADYCREKARVPDLLKMSGDDRREDPRFAIDTFTVNCVLIDSFGSKSKRSFRGELVDISQGGMAFVIRISSSRSARMLLGQQILGTISVAEQELPLSRGMIVGIRHVQESEKKYTIHVKFARRLDDNSMHHIRRG